MLEGLVGDVLGEIADHQSRIDPPTNPKDDPDHPWCVLDRERGYLENNQSRMDYPRYRRVGLPITSSPVESWVKQLNQCAKGSEKFWNNNANPEAVLNLLRGLAQRRRGIHRPDSQPARSSLCAARSRHASTHRCVKNH